MKKGFTLVEMLVVLAVLSLVGVMVVTIFSRSLRGANKSQILSSIKQNGQTILENMDKTIRGADSLVCISENPGSTIVIEREGIYIRYRFNIDETGKTNGAIRQDIASPSAQEADPRLFINRVCNPSDPMSSQTATVLSDTNSQTGVKIVAGSFARNKQAGFKDVVTITFILGPALEAPQVIAGQIDPVTFQTTVQIR